MGTFKLKVPSSHPSRALREIQPDGAEHPLSEGSVFGMTGEALANRVRGKAAGGGPQVAELTYTTPTRYKAPDAP